MSYSLNSLKGGYIGNGTTIGVIKGDTRSLDYSSYVYIDRDILVFNSIMLERFILKR